MAKALKAEQFKNLLHRDLMTKPVEVDTWHGRIFSSNLVAEKETVPFPLSL